VYTGRDGTLRPWAVYTAVTRYVHGGGHVPYTAVYMFVYTGSVHGQCARPKTAMHRARTLPCTRADTARTRPYGRFRPRRWPVHGCVHGPCTRRHVDTCTRPCTCRVHGRVHGPYTAVYTAVYTSRVRGRVRATYAAEDVRADGPYTVMYTGGVDVPCERPVDGRVGAVYTAPPAVFAGEDVFTGRVHGRRVMGIRHVTRPCTRPCTRHVTRPCTRPVRGRTTAVHGR